jgi:hypothetical protein
MTGGKVRKLNASPEAISFGFIVVPNGVDRDLYVETCLRRGRVSVMGNGGAFFRDIYITNEVLANIEFPEKENEQGSAVVIASNPYDGVPIVIGSYPRNDQSPMWKENTFQFRKTVGNVTASLSVDPANNAVIVSINSPKKASVKVLATGSEESEVIVESTGSVNVTGGTNVSVKGYTQIEAKVVNPEKPEEEERKVSMDLEKVYFHWKTEEMEQSLQVDNSGVSVKIGEDVQSTITKEQLDLKTGASTLKMNNDIIEFNGGGLKGLVELDNLTSKLNTFVQSFNSFVSTYNTHSHPVSTAGSATAQTGSTTGIVGSAQTAQSFNASDYENEKITQG